jgi:hypothetical protein
MQPTKSNEEISDSHGLPPEEKKRGFTLFGFFRKKHDNTNNSTEPTRKSLPVGTTLSDKTVVITPHKLKRIFGIDYGDVMETENRKCPKLVIDLIVHLKKCDCQNVEGIFRISGSQEEMDEIISRLEHSEKVNFNKIKDIHNISGLLKYYFRSMPSPLLTFNLFDSFIKIPTLEEKDEKLMYIRDTINLLSASRRFCFGLILELCFIISQNSRTNMMTPTNLSVVFGVNLLKLKNDSPMGYTKTSNLVTRTFEDLIQYFPEYKDIFGDLTQFYEDGDQLSDQSEDLDGDHLRTLSGDFGKII